MKERPILFSAPMVRAILAGTKTQTRRIVKPQPEVDGRGEWQWPSHACRSMVSMRDAPCLSPYGYKRDRLWVRETFGILTGNGIRTVYRADGDPMTSGGTEPVRDMKWHPSIFMRRNQSRITLEVTGVRVERVQAISDTDAIAEGARRFDYIHNARGSADPARWSMESPTNTDECLGGPRWAFANLWIKINGAESWDANPWVWVVEFRRRDHNAESEAA